MNKRSDVVDLPDAIELVLDAAKQHGEDDDPGHEAGDLQDHLRVMWKLLTPAQQIAFLKTEQVLDTIEVGSDDKRSQVETVVASSHGTPIESLYESLVNHFPGFLDDTDVNGGDLVDWVSVRLAWFRQTHDQTVGAKSTDTAAPTPTKVIRRPARDKVPLGTWGTLVTRDGTAIAGTLERMKGRGNVTRARRRQDGTFELQFHGTDVFDDESHTATNEHGEIIFLDEGGDEYPASEVKVVKE